MATHTITSGATASYAKALLELANEQNLAWEVANELNQLRELLDADPAFENYLSNPSVGFAEREPVLDRVFGGKLLPVVWNFIRLLNVKNRLGILRGIVATYGQFIDQQFGKIEVDVTVAVQLNDQELEEVRQAVGQALNRDATVHQTVDESIIGGLILRVQDKLIDTSVRAQLAAIKQKFLAARPKPVTVQ